MLIKYSLDRIGAQIKDKDAKGRVPIKKVKRVTSSKKEGGG